MRRMVALVTFGVCAASARASAEPKGAASATHAKARSAEKSGEWTYAALVAEADGDADGQVSPVELEALVVRDVNRKVASRFERLDRNGDGRVAPREVPTMLPERFRRFDADGDGAFTLGELARAMLARAKDRCRLVFAKLDHDGDGGLTLADAESATPTRVSKR
jgi:hypothetical protein